jgi:hypothetical protein
VAPAAAAAPVGSGETKRGATLEKPKSSTPQLPVLTTAETEAVTGGGYHYARVAKKPRRGHGAGRHPN